MNKVLVTAVVLLLVMGGIWFFARREQSLLEATPVPTVAPTTFITPTPTLVRTGFIGPTGLTAPGSCSLSGSIEFTAKDTFASYDAKIVYRNIDSDARLITWRISPNDALSVGPNLIGVLPLPDGSSNLTIKLPENPKAQSYALTATVDYAELVGNNVVVKTARCSGSIPVRLRY